MNKEKIKLIIKGLLTTAFVCLLLSVAARYLLPQFTDSYPPPSKEEQVVGNILGIGIWMVSFIIGFWKVFHDWKKV
jgi:hypothetical protein